MEASSEHNNVSIDSNDESFIDTQLEHGHIGIELSGDSQNSIGIMNDFD